MTEKVAVFWDSCVFITLLSKQKEQLWLDRQEVCRNCLQLAIEGKAEIFISTMTIVEVNKTTEAATPIPDSIKDKINELLNQPYIKVVSSDLARALEARGQIWTYGWLKPVDAMHLSCALHAKVREMFTYDGGGEKKGLLDLNGLVGIPPLKIRQPHFDAVQSTMPLPQPD